jgi:hypothetical protein
VACLFIILTLSFTKQKLCPSFLRPCGRRVEGQHDLGWNESMSFNFFSINLSSFHIWIAVYVR